MKSKVLDKKTKETIDKVFEGLSDLERDEAGYLWDEGFWYNLIEGKKLQWLADKMAQAKVNTDSVSVWRYIEQKSADCY